MVPFSRGKEEEVRTKVALMIVMVVVLVALVGSGTALAQMIGGVIQCQTKPCVANGDGGHDFLMVKDGDTMDGAIGGLGNDTCVVDATIEAADTCETVIVK